jgi:FlaA1/EpsC-like NDP-sugar epimerase
MIRCQKVLFLIYIDMRLQHKIAIVTGATGLVGRELMKELLSVDYYSKIIVVGRRSIEIKDNRIELNWKC